MTKDARVAGAATTESLHRHEALTRQQIARVAVSAGCDPRCVVKYLRKLGMNSTTIDRVERALRKCGFGHLVFVPTAMIARADSPEAALEAAALRASKESAAPAPPPPAATPSIARTTNGVHAPPNGARASSSAVSFHLAPTPPASSTRSSSSGGGRRN